MSKLLKTIQFLQEHRDLVDPSKYTQGAVEDQGVEVQTMRELNQVCGYGPNRGGGVIEYMWWCHITPHNDLVEHRYQILIPKEVKTEGWLNCRNRSVKLEVNKPVLFNNEALHSVSTRPLDSRTCLRYENRDYAWKKDFSNIQDQILFSGYGIMVYTVPKDCRQFWMHNLVDSRGLAL